jgi:menaquinone-dependent protoporphyrinogen IX oxidase
MKANLTILQKLDLYQIIAYAKEGKTDQVIERAQQMLREDESLVALSPDQWKELGGMNIEAILLGALIYKYEPQEAIAG